jgi:pimeloyl-ACP methyl ester carboxylesterase
MSFETAPTTDPEPYLLPTPVGPVAITREGPVAAPAIICCHGIPGSTRDFRYLAPQLVPALHVVRVEMPGFGATPLRLPRGHGYPSQGRRASVQGWADALDAVADALELAQYTLLGHSFAGSAVLESAVRRPERITALVLLAVPGAIRHRAYTAPPLVWRALSLPLAVPVLRLPLLKLAHWIYRRIGLEAPAEPSLIHHQVRVISSLSFTRIGRLAGLVQCPVWLFHCDNDRLVEPAIARDLASRLPDCRAKFYERGGHHLQKSRAQEIGAAISLALGREPRPGAATTTDAP